MQRKIINCDPDAWRKVASDINPLTGLPSTPLTNVICDAKGSDQMSMSHIRTFFSKKVIIYKKAGEWSWLFRI